MSSLKPVVSLVDMFDLRQLVAVYSNSIDGYTAVVCCLYYGDIGLRSFHMVSGGLNEPVDP